MELNTFGAILTYAIALEDKIAGYYAQAGNAARKADAEKRKSNLERVRRENVTEIKLEPIEGLREADYVIDFADISAEGQAALERTAAKFYEEVAPKINVREAMRALQRAGKDHAASA
jgi:hypothetical protein